MTGRGGESALELPACLLCVSLAWTLAVGVPPLFAPDADGLGRLVGYGLAAAAVLWLVPRSTARELGPAALPSFALGLAAGMTTYPLWVATVAALCIGLAIPPPAFLPGNGADPTILLAIGLLAPLFEELLFRGWLLSSLAARFGWTAAVIASALAFAAPHGNAWSILTAFLLGVVLALSRRAGVRMGACIGAHAGLNLAFLLRDPIATLEPPVWLAGIGVLLWAGMLASNAVDRSRRRGLGCDEEAPTACATRSRARR